jgi:DNA-binding response OmpR family regulator
MPGDRERCLAAGADAYLGKPVGLKVLAATIDDLLRRRAVAATANRNSA